MQPQIITILMICLSSMEKRYQYVSKEGITWSNWFPYEGKKYKYQLGNKLLNEYKEKL